ncbi:hypothetical protein, partial [uncultured Brachyspira sp.]|uniref:hypothetical protein n=1 Tax=uncultured Brachyspira sp. TaxID=221953 RepID=UPI00261467A4
KKTTDPTSNSGGGNTTKKSFGNLTIPEVDFGAVTDVEKSVPAKITGTPAGVTLKYSVKSAEGLDVLKAEHFSYDGNSLTLTPDGAKAVKASTDETTITITITVSADGYNNKDVEVKCKLSKA